MMQDPIWKAFAQTGDPLYYLLYRAVIRQERAETGKGRTGSLTAAVRF